MGDGNTKIVSWNQGNIPVSGEGGGDGEDRPKVSNVDFNDARVGIVAEALYVPLEVVPVEVSSFLQDKKGVFDKIAEELPETRKVIKENDGRIVKGHVVKEAFELGVMPVKYLEALMDDDSFRKVAIEVHEELQEEEGYSLRIDRTKRLFTGEELSAAELINATATRIFDIDVNEEAKQKYFEAVNEGANTSTDQILLSNMEGSNDAVVVGAVLGQMLQAVDSIGFTDRTVILPEPDSDKMNKLVGAVVSMRQLVGVPYTEMWSSLKGVPNEVREVVMSLYQKRSNPLQYGYDTVLSNLDGYKLKLLSDESRKNLKEKEEPSKKTGQVKFLGGVCGRELTSKLQGVDRFGGAFQDFAVQFEGYISSNCLVASVESLTEGLDLKGKEEYRSALYAYSKGEQDSSNLHMEAISVVVDIFDTIRNQYFINLQYLDQRTVDQYIVPDIVKETSTVLRGLDETVDPYLLLGIMFKAYEEVMPGWKEHKVSEMFISAFAKREDSDGMKEAGEFLGTHGAFNGTAQEKLLSSLGDTGEVITASMKVLNEALENKTEDEELDKKISSEVMSKAILEFGGRLKLK